MLGAEHPSKLNDMANLARIYWNQGRLTEAEELEVQVLETRRRVLGNDHPNTLLSMSGLAYTWMKQGCSEKSLPLLSHTVELSKRVLGIDHPETMGRQQTLDE